MIIVKLTACLPLFLVSVDLDGGKENGRRDTRHWLCGSTLTFELFADLDVVIGGRMGSYDTLYRNDDGANQFVPLNDLADYPQNTGSSLGFVAVDIDSDGDEDVFGPKQDGTIKLLLMDLQSPFLYVLTAHQAPLFWQ